MLKKQILFFAKLCEHCKLVKGQQYQFLINVILKNNIAKACFIFLKRELGQLENVTISSKIFVYSVKRLL